MTHDTKAKLASLDLHKLAMDLKTAPFWSANVGFCDLEIHELADLLLELATLRQKTSLLRYMESLEIQLKQYRMVHPTTKVGMMGTPVAAPNVVMVPTEAWRTIETLYTALQNGVREDDVQYDSAPKYSIASQPISIDVWPSTAREIIEAFRSAHPVKNGGAK